MPRRFTWLVVLTIGLMMLFTIPLTALAADYSVTDAAAELANVHKYVDDADKPAIQSARTAAQGLTDTQLDNLTNNLVTHLTPTALAYFAGADDAERQAAVQMELRGCFQDLATVVYSEDNLETILTNYKAAHTDTFQKLFGAAFTVDDLYGLILDMREQMPPVIDNSSTYFTTLESGTDAALVAILPSIGKATADSVLAQPEHSAFAAKLTEIGWTTQMLIDTYMGVSDAVDDASSSAELALVKAAVRSQMHLYKCDSAGTIISEIPANDLGERQLSIIPNQTVYFKLYLGDRSATGRSATQWVLWDSNSTNLTVDQMYDNGLTLKVTAGAAGTGGVISGYRDAGGTGMPAASNWLIKFTGLPFTYGDVNDDTLINITDAVTILQHITGSMTLTGNQLIAADVDGSTTVNITDAIMVLKRITDPGFGFPAET